MMGYLDLIVESPVRLWDAVPRTRGEAVEQLIRVRTMKARASLWEFVRASWEQIEPDTMLDEGWAIKAICDHVQWIMEQWALGRKNPRYLMALQNLLINIPPRCLKSIIVSVAAPAWAWLHWPGMTFICLSANPRVAEDNARKCLQLIQGWWYRSTFSPDWTVKADQEAVSNYALERINTDHGGDRTTLGWRKSRGWGGKIIGEGADCIIADDPHDAKEIHSKVKRENVCNEWKAIYNRVRDRRFSIRIGIMQRLHPEDWAAFVVKLSLQHPDAPRWVQLTIPLEHSLKRHCMTTMPVKDNNEYTAGGKVQWQDPRTADGEIMDPVRWTASVIGAEKVALGSFGYSAQCNQNPTFPDGGMFQRSYWRFFRIDGDVPLGGMRPERCTDLPARTLKRDRSGRLQVDSITLSVDATFKDKEDSDRVGMIVFANERADRFILHDATEVMSFTKTIEVIRYLVKIYRCTTILIEEKANGPAIMNVLTSEISGIIGVEPMGGKEARAYANSPAIEAGNVYLLDGASWLEEFIGEFSDFPKVTHDDRVDAVTQGLTHYAMDPTVAMALASCQM